MQQKMAVIYMAVLKLMTQKHCAPLESGEAQTVVQ